MSQYGPLILIEIVMVFGGALAFGWWQLRDLRREREKREAARRAAQQAATSARDSESGHAA